VREPEVAELRAFCAAATLGTIAEAARSLNVSQPALSKRLRTLEAVVGAELFQRSTRGVTLTDAGAHLYSAARRLLSSADTVQALLSNPAAASPVRIAASPTVADLRLPDVLANIARVEASLSVEVIAANSPVVRDLVREGRVDLGIAGVDPDRPQDDGLTDKVIWRDEVIVAVPDGHAWVDYDEIPAVEFAETPMVQLDPWSNSSRVVATALIHAGLQRALPYAAIGSSTAVVAVARATGRPALLSQLVAREHDGLGFTIRRVEGMRFDREFALVWTGQVSDLPAPVQVIAQYILDLPFARSRRARRAFVAGA
jgi:DNA-binding transcriptional LysR family regulator